MLVDFIIAKWYLFAMLVVVVFLLASNPGARAKVTPMQLPKLQAREQAVVVDVETKENFRNGHIANAINLPLEDIKNQPARIAKYKTRALILCCENGMRSSKAAAALRRQQFEKLYVLDGGMAAWRKENMPLVKGDK